MKSLKNKILIILTIVIVVCVYVGYQQYKNNKAIEFQKQGAQALFYKKYDKAEALLNESLRYNKKNQYTYLSYSTLYCEQGNVKQAFDILKESENYAELNSPMLTLLGQYLDSLGDTVGAHKYYTLALEKMSPDDLNRVLVKYYMDPNLDIKLFHTLPDSDFKTWALEDIEKTSLKEFIESLKRVCG